MPAIDLSILNQRQTPAFYADVFANRPAAGFVGRIFVSTNTFAFYRDNGTGWDLIGGPGTGTITGSGTAGTIPLWNGASTIGNSIITQNGSIVEIKDPTFDAYLVLNTNNVFSNLLFHNNNVKRASAYYREDLLQLTYGTYVTGGSIEFETDNNVTAVIIDSLQNTTFYGNIIRNGGTSSQFLKADGSLDSSAYVTTNIYNGNGTLSAERTVALNGHNLIFDGGASVARVRLDADTNVARIFSFATNNVARWAFRIDDAETGSNAGSNFAVRRYDDAGVFVDSPLLINRATGQSTFAKKVVIENNAGDQQLQIVSTTAPSLRIDNLQTGATKRAGLGLSTTVNNFIQGSVDRDFCVFNSSTTASPILFGIYDAGLTNTQEAARISASRNFLIGTTTDAGQKLQVNGTALITGATTFNSSLTANNFIASGGNNTTILNSSNATTGWVQVAMNNTTGSALIGIESSVAGTLTTGSTAYSTIIRNYTNTDLQLATNNIVRQTITSAGNVGIGTTTVTSKLQISSSFAGVATVAAFLLNENTNINTETRLAFAANTNNDIATNRYSYISALNTSGSNGQALTFATNATGSAAVEAMRISSSQNVLIGTTTDAGYKLAVNGDVNATSFVSTRGIISVAPVTFTTFFTPTTSGLYIARVYLAGNTTSVWDAAIMFIYDVTDILVMSQINGTNVSTQVSGANVQVRQIGGTTYDFNFDIIKIR